MSSLVLSQLLNPETGIDRKAAGNIPDLATDGKEPSRYDDIVRHQEKRLARQRVEDRARARADEQERQVELRRSDRAASRQDSSSSPAEQRQAESRHDRNDGNAMASKPSRGKQVSDSKNPEDVADPKAEASADIPDPDTTAMAEVPATAGITGPALFAGGGAGSLIPGPLAASGPLPGTPPAAGALFAALLGANGDSSTTGGTVFAGLQGAGAQAGGESAGKFAGILMSTVTPELAQTLNPPAALRGQEAQALMRGYATSVETPVGQSEWGEKVMGKLAWLTASQMAVAEIHITPPELGPLDVRVQVQNDQATVTVHATTPAVREQLELHGHRLRDMLSEQGFSLEGFDVTDSAGRQASDQHEDGERAGESGSGRLAGEGVDGEVRADGSGALDLSWHGEVDVYV